MSDQVTFAHVLQFTTNVKHRLQQEGAKLRMTVMQGTHTGNGAVPVEQIGAVTAQERLTRHGDTPILDTPHSRRWVHPRDFEWGDMVDKQDLIRMLIDPKSPYTTAGVNALGRQIDDLIINALDGTSVVGAIAGGGNTTTEAFDTAAFQITATAGLTLADIREASRRFMNANLDLDREEMYLVIGPSQWSQLLADSVGSGATASALTISSRDYNPTNSPIIDGRLPQVFGFRIIVSTRLRTVGADTVCLAYAKSGGHLGIWNDIEVRAQERADKGFNTQVYARLTAGATRLEQGRVIRILADT